jgi:Methyltransferase domain
MLDLRPYLRRPVSTLAAVAADPVESWIRFREQYAAHREGGAPPDLYKPADDWADRLNALLGISLPDKATSEFWSLWPRVIQELAAKGVQAGPESFKGWNDGDAAFVRAIWCLTRHLRPKNVIETGVAHGVTSRFILEALERNGTGHLWSIDRPPMERDWQEQIGLAVVDSLRPRWSYIRGSSRRRLPAVLSRLGEIELFVHDSLHSERNVRFEMDQAWAALRPGGAIVVDDVDVNRGFHSFARAFSNFHSIIGEAEPLRPDPRRFNKKGLFGIVLKERIAFGECQPRTAGAGEALPPVPIGR